MSEPAAKNNLALKFLLRAFQHRNYRLFFGGQGISLIGTWMQQIAMSWLVYRLTDSAFMLGLIGFSAQIPTFLFASIAGVYADRWDRRYLLVITQTIAMLQAFTLAFLTLTGLVQVWHLLVLSALSGLVNAFDIPARQSFVIDLIEDRDDLGNAIALNSFMFNGARLIGPSVAGILISLFGEGGCFLINGFSFLGIIGALGAMNIRKCVKRSHGSNFWRDLMEGYSYAFRFMPIRAILLQLALISFLGMPYAVLMPVYARDILHGGPHTLGFLMAFAGIGALAGAVFLASRKSILGLDRLIAVATCIFGTAMILFSLSKIPLVSYLMLCFVGFGLITQMAASNTILQSIVEEDKRGRIMSLFAVSGIGMMPFGSLYSGMLAGQMGAPLTLIISGTTCIVGALLFASSLPRFRADIRPIYLEKGIISESITRAK